MEGGGFMIFLAYLANITDEFFNVKSAWKQSVILMSMVVCPTSEITGPGRTRHGKHYEHRPRLRCIDLLGGM
jgi:hypothetical protein